MTPVNFEDSAIPYSGTYIRHQRRYSLGKKISHVSLGNGTSLSPQVLNCYLIMSNKHSIRKVEKKKNEIMSLLSINLISQYIIIFTFHLTVYPDMNLVTKTLGTLELVVRAIFFFNKHIRKPNLNFFACIISS